MATHDAACRREDLVAAYEDLVTRLAARRQAMWDAYLEATRGMTRREYELHESECWSVLHAGLAGLDAEQRLLQRDFEGRLAAFGEPGVAGAA